MQDARATLKKIFAETLRREGGDNSPMLAWPLACGATVASRTLAVSFENGELTVQVADSAWRSQLQVFTTQYLAALNQVSTHHVKSLRFVLPNGPQSVQQYRRKERE